MARFDVSLLGDKDLERRLRGLTEKVERNILTRSLRAAATVVRNQAQANIRPRGVVIQPGASRRRERQLRRLAQNFARLRNSLIVRPLKRSRHRVGSAVYTGTRAQLGITGQYYYPAHVELGHGPPTGRRRRGLSRLARRTEFGGRRTPPSPYLRPALISRRAEALGIIAGELRRRLPQEATRG